MASQQDIQDLLRLLTTGRNKLNMMAAMGRVKALQSANLRSISEIAASDLPTIATALSDPKAAKSLLAACKAHLKSDSTNSGVKRAASSTLSSSSKRPKSAYELSVEPQTPSELEASLELPQPSADQEAIEKCCIYTNRAPLVLAWAVSLLKFTMPEQPLSGRLSLAQAVVSANSRSKAVSLGIEKGKGAEEEGWAMGQPKVKIMGREISVLKRSGYEWREPQEEPETEKPISESKFEVEKPSAKEKGTSTPTPGNTSKKPKATDGWMVSSPITSKKSTFIARSITITSPSEVKSVLQKLMANHQELREANHNMTAFRIQSSYGIIEDSNDDGESGGGRHLLNLLQADNLTNILLVVTRWYGGIMLGTDRWRIMTQVSRDAVSQRLHVAGVLGHEALWGLDLEAMRSKDSPVLGGSTGGMPIYRPEGARSYILKAFASPPSADEGSKKKKSGAVLEREREENLGLLLGALDLLLASWVGHMSGEELDRRAWGWYVQTRPEVADGPAGWGAKGVVKLADILSLRRNE